MASVVIKNQWVVVWSKNHPTLIYRTDELVGLTDANNNGDSYEEYGTDYLDDLEYVADYDPYERIIR